MKKKFLGALFGILAMVAFATFNTINTVEAQEELTNADEKSWDLRVCINPGGPHTAGCDMPAIAGPCWRSEAC